MNCEQKKMMEQPQVSSELPQIMREVADVLRAEGCHPAEIRAALLTMCGVQAGGAKLGVLRAFG